MARPTTALGCTDPAGGLFALDIFYALMILSDMRDAPSLPHAAANLHSAIFAGGTLLI